MSLAYLCLIPLFSSPCGKIANRLLERMKALYEEGRKKDPEVFKDDIRLRANKVRAVVGYLQDINLSDTDLDSKGRAFETFMGSFFRGDFGQYFTPRPIVKFIVDVLPITHESRVLDTSCGSGGFLLHALDKVRFEADNYYPDEIAVPSEGRKEGARHHRHWHDFAEKNLFGIEINEQIARTAKMNMIIHDDGHTNVVAADGLLPPDDLAKKTANKEFKANSFDFIITNPPFGSSVRQTEQAYFHQYRLANKNADWLNPKSKTAKRPAQDTEILFIEQCHGYLREGGYLAVVVPDGILTNSSLQYVRDEIESLYRIVAVVSLPQTAFAATGAGVKSSVLFLQKQSTLQTKMIDDLRQNMQDTVKVNQNYDRKLAAIDQAKKKTLKGKVGFINSESARRAALQLVALRENNPEEKVEIEATLAYQAWKKEVSDGYAEEVDELKVTAIEAYETALQNSQVDYEVFMAIAEDIGYDATGKSTKVNDLDEISNRFVKFLSGEPRKQRVNDERVFIANLKEISGSLFDPKTYRPSSRALLARIVQSDFPLHALRSLITHRSAGDWGEDEDFEDEEDTYTKCLVIRGTEFDNELNLKIANGREKYRQIRTSKLTRMRIEPNDLLIEKSGGSPDQPVGRVAIINAELLASKCICYSNFVEKIKPDSIKVIPAYLFHYLKFIHNIGVTNLLQSQTNGIRNLMIHRYLDIPISVPPLPVQQQLIDAIHKLQNDAISLRALANKNLVGLTQTHHIFSHYEKI
jgi:type I restriction-modification system DNA methylase subunit